MNPNSSPRTRRALALLALLVTALAGLYGWATHDAPALERELPQPGRARELIGAQAYGALKSLSETFPPGALKRVPPSYEGNRESADALLATDAAKQLPERLDRILRTREFQPDREPIRPDNASIVPANLRVISVLRLKLQKLLADNDPDAAWQTARLALNFASWLREHTHALHELTVADAGQIEVLRALVSSMRVNSWPADKLGAFTTLQDPATPADRLLAGLDGEYARVVDASAAQNQQVVPFFRAWSYQPNRTRRSWLDATAESVTALKNSDLVAAYRALEQAATATRDERAWVRNQLGQQMIFGSMLGLVYPIAGEIDTIAAYRLLKLAAALRLYQAHHGRLPDKLEQLLGAFIAVVPKDPWTNEVGAFRYLPAEQKLYSIGADQSDDRGSFTQDLAQRDARDFGIRLSE